MERDLIYLDTYVLQQDMRIRLPKSIINNIGAVKGKTHFAIYLDTVSNELILRVVASETEDSSGR